MKQLSFASIAALLSFVLLAWPPVSAQTADAGFVVVVNRANPVSEISRADLARMFLKQTPRWSNGQSVEPVDLVGSSPIREAFSRRVHQRSASSVISYWRQQIFSGRGVPPPEQANEAGVIRYVSGHAGAVGYVSATANVSTVKVLRVTGL